MLKIDVRKGLLVAAALLAALPAHSAEPEIWTMTTRQGSCRLSFEEDPVAEGVLSTLFHDGSCFDFTNPVTGYSMNNGDHTIILYSTKDGLTMVGRADMEEPGHYLGVIGDGEELTLVQDGGKPAPRPVAAPAGPCPTYVDGGCAQPSDVGSPDVAAGVTSIQALTRMNIRAMPDRSGAVLGKLDQNQCVTVIGCVEQNGSTMWCEIEMGTYRGWVLKHDAGKIYIRNACG
ncbi:MAG: SH3 domain-containing protein [Alphaproteobacteria bacterium]|nr:SH3 domain-containing protein [Alphaproteobacteria bacterium]MBU4048193.1 SH3 domain-containing protein [Alphaproteobacteria bacterium]MBU4089262.1 SH3 domain-containing protein [Alphaproteobacteria bacterium]MBU4158736.1 SH3 domain-containing protein [Alphaproteobacteria bacterium]